MVTAALSDKERIIEILAHSFDRNASVNFIVKQDKARARRIRLLMGYAFKVCSAFGKVVLSEDRNACALVMLEKKRFSFAELLWDIRLIFGVSGVSKVARLLKREALIKNQHPSLPFYYVWFIGVHPVHRGYGAGSALLAELIADADAMGLPVYLETSTLRNLPWYEGFGFSVFFELDIGYKLFFLRREVPPLTTAL